ncbi:MAG: hypothetical protein H6Q84_1619 [Deltaproteobacteria bacterium]|nr:hypothetical protein [Deltaproteobacteria bacterium]
MLRKANIGLRIVRSSLLAIPVLWGFGIVHPATARAEGISGYLEYNFNRYESKTDDAGGRTSRTESDAFSQLYSLTLDKRIFPNLGVLASGNFERTGSSVEIDGVDADATTTKIRPYLNLYLRTPLYSAEAIYSRNEDKVSGSGIPSLTTVHDLISSTFFWKPDRFPDLRIQFFRDLLYDENREIVDTTTDTYLVTSNYRPADTLQLYYQGTYRETDIRISDVSTTEAIHNGKGNYSNSWLGRRIALSMDYNVTYQALDTESKGTGEVGVGVFPFSGLSAVTDIPETGILLANPALIDGVFQAGAGINLGLPPPGGDTRPRNIGLDFLVPTELNTLYVWVDRDVSQVASSFSWRIYTSGDNLNWTLRQTVAPAFYSTTYNRFEIRFANVSDRYVKVVVSPLSPTVPFATQYPDILVTELQAEVRKPSSEVAGTLRSTFQTGTLDFRALLLESVNLTYELTGYFTDRDPGELAYTVSNGLSFFRQFTPVVSGRGRVAYETGEEQAGSRDAVVYTASMTAVPVQSLFQSLTLSGREETIAGEKSSDVSIILYNNARLYNGIDMNLSGGISFQEDADGQKDQVSLLNVGATFVPNRKATVTLLYNGTTTVSSGGELPAEKTTYTRAGEASVSFTPVPTFYLFGSYRIERFSDSPDRDILNYSVNWSPFPDGTVQFTFYYNESVRTDDTRDRSIVPGVRWYFTPRSYVNLSYQNLKTASPAVTTTSDVYSGTVRVAF